MQITTFSLIYFLYIFKIFIMYKAVYTARNKYKIDVFHFNGKIIPIIRLFKFLNDRAFAAAITFELFLCVR